MRAPTLPPPAGPRKRKKRRKSLLLSFLGFAFGTFVLVFVAGSAGAGFLIWQASRDLPDYESLSKYEPPVMTRIHAHDGSLISEFARERRIFVPDQHDPEARHRRLSVGRGPPLLRARRHRYARHFARRLRRRRSQDPRLQQACAGRVDHHAAGRQELPADQRTLDRTQDQGGHSRHPHRARLFEGPHPRALPQRNLSRHERLRRRSGWAHLFQQGAQGSDDRGGRLPRGLPKAPNNYHPFRQKEKATERRNWIIGQMAENGYITGGRGRGREEEAADRQFPHERRAHFDGRVLCRGSAAHAAYEVRRRQTLRRRSVGAHDARSATAADRTQGADRTASSSSTDLQGWRGPVAKIDISGDWGVALGAISSPSDIQPWRLGVVLETQKTKAIIGFKPARQQDATLVKDREAVEVSLDEMKWAAKTPGKQIDAKSTSRYSETRRRRLRRAERSRTTFRVPGPLDADPRGRRRPRCDGPLHRPRARRRRRLLLRHEPVRPRDPGQAPAGLVVQAVRLRRRRSTTATSRRRSSSTRRSRSIRARVRTSGSPRTTTRRKRPDPRR